MAASTACQNRNVVHYSCFSRKCAHDMYKYTTQVSTAVRCIFDAFWKAAHNVYRYMQRRFTDTNSFQYLHKKRLHSLCSQILQSGRRKSVKSNASSAMSTPSQYETKYTRYIGGRPEVPFSHARILSSSCVLPPPSPGVLPWKFPPGLLLLCQAAAEPTFVAAGHSLIELP